MPPRIRLRKARSFPQSPASCSRVERFRRSLSRSSDQGIAAKRLHRSVGLLEENVPMRPDVELIARRDLDRGLNVEILPRYLCAELAHLSTHRAFGFLARIWSDKNALLPALGNGERGIEYTGQDREAEQLLVMMIHRVAKTGITLGILARHPAKINGRSVGKDHALPRDLHSTLPVADPRVVPAHQPRSLRYQQVLTGCGIVHVRHHKRLQ